MMYPYAKFLIDFDQRHGSLKHRNSPSNTKAAVIIESRPLFFLPMVLKNLMFFLGGEWNLHIFSGELSEKYVDDIVDGWDVSVTKLEGLRHLSAAHRSEIMKTTQFWKLFPEEKLLIFESNCCRVRGEHRELPRVRFHRRSRGHHRQIQFSRRVFIEIEAEDD